MNKFRFILSGTTLLTSLFLSGQAFAKPEYPAAAPASYHIGGLATGGNMVSCGTCHNGTANEDNVTTSFGVAFEQLSDDDNGGSLVTAYNTLAPFDSDGDGFSNQQEAYAGSSFNSVSTTPALASPDKTSTGLSAKASVGGPVSVLSLQAGVPTTALGGTASFESPASVNNTTTTDFMFKAGGAQSGAAATFYDANGAIIPTNTADGAGGANTTNGSVNIIVKDEGVFDLYTTSTLQAAAKAKYNSSSLPLASTLSLNPYASINPYARIGTGVTIHNNASIDAYAIVDTNAVVGVYAQIGSYAYLAPQVDIYAGTISTYAQISPYAQVAASITTPGVVAGPNGAGHVSAKFSVITTPPTKRILGSVEPGASGGTSGTSTTGAAGGLHCMTSGLSSFGFMFFGLLVTTLLVHRKKS
ncbi:MAG: hypothetical protein R8M46_05670 [Ghiorsea sp.]